MSLLEERWKCVGLQYVHAWVFVVNLSYCSTVRVKVSDLLLISSTESQLPLWNPDLIFLTSSNTEKANQSEWKCFRSEIWAWQQTKTRPQQHRNTAKEILLNILFLKEITFERREDLWAARFMNDEKKELVLQIKETLQITRSPKTNNKKHFYREEEKLLQITINDVANKINSTNNKKYCCW